MRKTSWAAAILAVIMTGPAMAACYETIGCTDSEEFAKRDLRQLSCQGLWDVRNTIYKENGYCFSSKRAISYFGNKGCFVRDQGAVKLNAYERHNVAQIVAVERAKGCD